MSFPPDEKLLQSRAVPLHQETYHNTEYRACIQQIYTKSFAEGKSRELTHTWMAAWGFGWPGKGISTCRIYSEQDRRAENWFWWLCSAKRRMAWCSGRCSTTVGVSQWASTAENWARRDVFLRPHTVGVCNGLHGEGLRHPCWGLCYQWHRTLGRGGGAARFQARVAISMAVLTEAGGLAGMCVTIIAPH